MQSLDYLAPVLTASPLNPQHRLNQGLLGRWLSLPPLDGGTRLYDLRGLMPAPLTASPTWVSSPGHPGALGPALKFNGSSQYINMTNLIPSTGICTIAGWILPVSGDSGIVLEARDSSGRGLLLYANPAISGSATAFMYNGTTTYTSATSTSPFDGKWHHLALTFDGTNLQAYLDGSAAGASPTAASYTSTSTTMRVAQAYNGALAPCTTDDLALWSRALSANEIWELYDTCRRGSPGVLNRLDVDWLAPFQLVYRPPSQLIMSYPPPRQFSL